MVENFCRLLRRIKDLCRHHDQGGDPLADLLEGEDRGRNLAAEETVAAAVAVPVILLALRTTVPLPNRIAPLCIHTSRILRPYI